MRRSAALRALVFAVVLFGTVLGAWPQLRAAHGCCAGTARASDRDQAQVMEPCCCDHDCATHPGCGCVQSRPKRTSAATPAPLRPRLSTEAIVAPNAIARVLPPLPRVMRAPSALVRPPDIPAMTSTPLRC